MSRMRDFRWSRMYETNYVRRSTLPGVKGLELVRWDRKPPSAASSYCPASLRYLARFALSGDPTKLSHV